MKARVLVIGYGNVGKRTTELILERQSAIISRWGLTLELVGVVRRQPWGPGDLPQELLYNDPYQAIESSRPDIVVELIGGVEPARSIILAALEAGAHVVTANKAVLAVHGPELRQAAVDGGRLLLAEASVGGAIPVLRTLHTTLAADRIDRILGVWNGTCNYILTEMEGSGANFQDVLIEAQRLGFAEADPELDVGGGDTAHKASVLAQLSFGVQVDLQSTRFRGIGGLLPGDFSTAKQLGMRPKMVGLLERRPGGLAFYVGLALLPISHPVAELEGVRNGIWIEGDTVGGVFLAGPGAGPYPTAVTVLGDIIEAARLGVRDDETPRGPVIERWGLGLTNGGPDIIPYEEQRFPYYLRLLVPDSSGVLGRIAGTLGEFDISIGSMVQPWRHRSEHVPIYMTTDETTIGKLEQALDAMNRFDFPVLSPMWMPILEREES